MSQSVSDQRQQDRRALLHKLDALTSANLSGEPPALTVVDAVAAVGRFVDLALDAGLSPGGTPSTVARIEDGVIKILREGAVPLTALERECRND